MRNLKETNGRKFEEELRMRTLCGPSVGLERLPIPARTAETATKGNAVENDPWLKNLCEAEVVVVDEACMLEAEKYAAAIEAVKNEKK